MRQICPRCSRSVEPLEKVVRDKKKTWLIKSCPNERCKFNFDIEATKVKVWNDKQCSFEDLTDERGEL